jgi:hypothetical protein
LESTEKKNTEGAETIALHGDKINRKGAKAQRKVLPLRTWSARIKKNTEGAETIALHGDKINRNGAKAQKKVLALRTWRARRVAVKKSWSLFGQQMIPAS